MLVGDDTDAAALRQGLTPVKTQSKVFDVLSGEAAHIRQVVEEAKKDHKILSVRDMEWFTLKPPGSAPTTLSLGGYAAPSLTVSAQGGVTISEVETGIRLQVDQPEFRTVYQTHDYQGVHGEKQEQVGTLDFEGVVPPGKAIVFLGKVGTKGESNVWHAMVWEVFGCSAGERPYIELLIEPWPWTEVGPTGAREFARRALTWRDYARTHPVKVAGKWERHLDNGATLRLVGVSVPVRSLGCWWDGDGNPVEGSAEWGPELFQVPYGVWGVFEVEDPAQAQWQGQSKRYSHTASLGLSWGTPWRTIRGGNIGTSNLVQPLAVHVAAGAWQDLFDIRVGETKRGHGVEATLEVKDLSAQGRNFKAVNCLWTGPPDVDVDLALFDEAGKLLSPPALAKVEFSRGDIGKGWAGGTYGPSLRFAKSVVRARKWSKGEFVGYRQDSAVPLERIVLPPQPSPTGRGPMPAP